MSGSLHGVMARYATAGALVAAARAAYAAGYREMDAYAPQPVAGLAAAIGFRRTRLPLVIFLAGAAAGAFMLWFAWWISAVDYPLNVGGRAPASWPAFVVPVFELTVLTAAVVGLVAMLARNGLPRPHHPVFDAPGFERASRDRFFLCIEATDPRFDAAEVRRFLEGNAPGEAPEEVVDVPG